MKAFILTFVFFLIAFFNQDVFAQKNHPHPKKHNKHVKVVKVKHNNHHNHHYYRKNCVIVRHRKINTFAVLPNGHAILVFKGNNHYYHNGFYYRNVNNSFHLLPPPFGLRIAILPFGHTKIFFGARPHYYYKGVYYRQIDNEYEVVEPEIGTLVPELPEDNVEEVTIDGENYYEYDNYLYKTKVTTEGVKYEVVGKLED